ncbi:S-adenosylmethionine synthetase [Halalkaliarchaeum desulfuricum]|uniref:S-adenosylmethionine synthetase n=1 Tax=Halalkaliarchaeum desulfuricum TaxID=2055893 RepID=A0A343TLR7_9EURY|nr:methionine adenosyltransferase [Halalkaliarchaeum desulfuricum]AUX10039.1 S-adenosylmethionine synthetase [Halalkaliarchaeum desulfuricum]
MSSLPITVSSIDGDPIEDRQAEFVERKGFGHPDTICDGIAEAVSRALCREYQAEFGRVLHHNTDSVLLIAGDSTPEFGGGSLNSPIRIVLGGQATAEVEDTTIPINEIAEQAAHGYLETHFEHLPSGYVDIWPHLGPTSVDLQDLFDRGDVLANDTSIAIGYAPLSGTEEIVKTLEPRIWQEVDAAGKDVKVMAARSNGHLHLVIATAIISSQVSSVEEYLDVKGKVRDLALAHARARTDREVRVDVNTADNPDNEIVYITETGLSAEDGDDGGVGRGNRVTGLITPHRHMSMEATAGKNPISHVGKLYNVLAKRTAERIATETDATFANVHMVSEIGMPIAEPDAVDVEAATTNHSEIADIVRSEARKLDEITTDIIAGDVELF